MDVGERYSLGRLVGEGATARVYEAEDAVLEREVAVKLFRHPEVVGDSTAGRIDEETRILTRLAHPHLLPVYDSGRDADGHRFLVMPLVRGTTLAALVAGGPVDPREVKRIGTALAGALAHIHALGIVHRDVKPSNVLLAEDGTPYLADFGFAHAADGPALTDTGCVVGTAGYLAPEQAEGHGVTAAVDVYALGLVLLEALTGEREYRGTPLERATANALRAPRLPARLGPGWLRVLRSMTARTPSARASAAEVGALLASAEDLLPGVTAFDDTMELSPVGVGSGLPVGTVRSATPVGTVAPARTARLTRFGRPQAHRRLAVFGAAAVTAVAVIGGAADLLTAGAAADTIGPGVVVPSQSKPSAGTTAPQRAAVPPAAPASASGSSAPGTPARPASTAHTPSGQNKSGSAAATSCQGGDGQQGKGNGGHKCKTGHGDG